MLRAPMLRARGLPLQALEISVRSLPGGQRQTPSQRAASRGARAPLGSVHGLYGRYVAYTALVHAQPVLQSIGVYVSAG
jgi:hypothetical protein